MPGLDLSTKKDALRAIDQGIEWLKARQNSDGSWPGAPQPAVSALAMRAILRTPARERGRVDESAGKGLEFIASCAQKDGGIYRDSAMGNCNTAASLLALADSRQQRYEPLILGARRFLARRQLSPEVLKASGGWAHGDSPADLKTTALVIEALAATQRISTADAEENKTAPADPDWAAAVAFLSRCQNMDGKRPQDLGGFFSAADRAGPQTLHSEGSATALGLAAMLESNVARSDPRVLAAVNWLRSNYTLDEEAGGPFDPAQGRPGKRGLCFYYYSLAGALTLYGEEPLLRPGERAADWRRELMIKLMSLQRTDEQGLGYWVNDQGDQGDQAEKDPVLVTAYCVLALETLVNGPPY
jgi:squalene-hopene/tetraprenyl-beta-curcumene cyclase